MISALKFTMNTCFCVFTNTFRSGDHIQGDHPIAETLNCSHVMATVGRAREATKLVACVAFAFSPRRSILKSHGLRWSLFDFRLRKDILLWTSAQSFAVVPLRMVQIWRSVSYKHELFPEIEILWTEFRATRPSFTAHFRRFADCSGKLEWQRTRWKLQSLFHIFIEKIWETSSKKHQIYS